MTLAGYLDNLKMYALTERAISTPHIMTCVCMFCVLSHCQYPPVPPDDVCEDDTLQHKPLVWIPDIVDLDWTAHTSRLFQLCER